MVTAPRAAPRAGVRWFAAPVVIALAVTSGSVAAALVALAFVIAAAALINARVARLLDDSSDPEDVDVDAR